MNGLLKLPKLGDLAEITKREDPLVMHRPQLGRRRRSKGPIILHIVDRNGKPRTSDLEMKPRRSPYLLTACGLVIDCWALAPSMQINAAVRGSKGIKLCPRCGGEADFRTVQAGGEPFYRKNSSWENFEPYPDF